MTAGSATHLSVHLARFGDVIDRPAAGLDPPAGSPITWLVGADEAGSGSEFASQRSSEFVAVGVHSAEVSARLCAGAPVGGFGGAVETWSGAFLATRAIGTCNWMTGDAALTIDAPSPSHKGALAVLTTAGWVMDEHFDLSRAMSFADAVARVRAAGSDVDGMHSMQLFTFPGIVVSDGITFTFWRDEAAMRSYAYRPGAHKTELDAFRLNETADRTSFTRLRPLSSHGTWRGSDPVAAAL